VPGSRTRGILRWPDGWTIEDALGALIAADATVILAQLAADPAIGPVTVASLVARLKSKDRTTGGIKGDTLAYEAIAAALADSRNARTCVSELLHAIAAASANEVTARFVVEPGAAGPVTAWVFAPWG
jgi:putative ATP-dependent endonuclease of OLD family